MPAAATGRREASSPSPAYTAVEAAVICARRRGGGHAAASGQGDDCAAGWRAAHARRTGAEATPPAPDPSLEGTLNASGDVSEQAPAADDAERGW